MSLLETAAGDSTGEARAAPDDAAAARGGWRASLAAAVAANVVLALLCWPLPLHSMDHVLQGPFSGSQVWLFDHVYRMVSFERPMSPWTDGLGYPGPVRLPIMGWSVALAVAPLNALVGPWGAFNASLPLAIGAAAALATALIRRVTGASPWTAAGASLVFALSPNVLGALANVQEEKLQHWVVPLVLLAFVEWLRRPIGVRPLLFFGAAVGVASFTAPDYTLHLPILLATWAGLWGLAELTRAGARPRGVVTRDVVTRLAFAALVAAVAALPSVGYFLPSGAADALVPAQPTLAGVGEIPCPVAQPEHILFGGLGTDSPADGVHLVYLGIPAILVAGALVRRRFPGRGLGIAILVVCTVLALGPWLASSGAHVTILGLKIPLPALLLDAVGYPLRQSGMYYRLMADAALGLALLIAGGLTAWRPQRAALFAWGAALLFVGDGVRSSWPLWPRPLLDVADLRLDAQLAADAAPGAVMELPGFASDRRKPDGYLLSAVVHRRPTTRMTRPEGRASGYVRVMGVLRLALQERNPASARARLAAAGLRFIVWRDAPGSTAWPTLAELTAALGPPDATVDGVGAGSYWRIERVPPASEILPHR